MFVRFKGFYEGVYKGFYRSQDIEHRKYKDECLGHDSYEALDVIVHAWDQAGVEDYSELLMGLTALVKMLLDNQRNC